MIDLKLSLHPANLFLSSLLHWVQFFVLFLLVPVLAAVAARRRRVDHKRRLVVHRELSPLACGFVARARGLGKRGAHLVHEG